MSRRELPQRPERRGGWSTLVVTLDILAREVTVGVALWACRGGGAAGIIGGVAVFGLVLLLTRRFGVMRPVGWPQAVNESVLLFAGALCLMNILVALVGLPPWGGRDRLDRDRYGATDDDTAANIAFVAVRRIFFGAETSAAALINGSLVLTSAATPALDSALVLALPIGRRPCPPSWLLRIDRSERRADRRCILERKTVPDCGRAWKRSTQGFPTWLVRITRHFRQLGPG